MTETVNKSGLAPRGRAVLVKPYEPEKKQGLIVIPDAVQERTQMVEQRAVVIEVGPAAWIDEHQPRAKVGDKVLVAKFAGAMAIGTMDGEKYRFVNDRDIFAVITGEKE
jgi:co-chaperonin GroES (HSP10)